MTRPGKSLRDAALSDLFTSDAAAAVLRVLEKAAAALTAGEVKKALYAGGVAKVDADKVWPAVQKKIKSSGQVIVESGNRYRWTARPSEISAVLPSEPAALPREPSALEALELLAKGRLAASRKTELLAIIRAALISPNVDLEMAARQRQAEIDAVRALAELASEVEELTANEVESVVMVRSVRAWMMRSELEPIDRAGEETTFDRKRHKPIGPPIRDGAPVVVVRPGYVWKASPQDVLIAKAVVEE